jgi:hypothetical protein
MLRNFRDNYDGHASVSRYGSLSPLIVRLEGAQDERAMELSHQTWST